jgi:hypothetical protein
LAFAVFLGFNALIFLPVADAQKMLLQPLTTRIGASSGCRCRIACDIGRDDLCNTVEMVRKCAKMAMGEG